MIAGDDRHEAKLLISNRGAWTIYPLMEDVATLDFQGSTGILRCPKHDRFYQGRPTGPPTFPGFPPAGMGFQSGMNVRLPFFLLREPYEEFRRTERTQTLFWMPGKSPTIIADDPLL